MASCMKPGFTTRNMDTENYLCDYYPNSLMDGINIIDAKQVLIIQNEQFKALKLDPLWISGGEILGF